MMYLKLLEKQEINQTKNSRRRKIRKIRADL
jgi:hypothetical protein